MQRAKLVAVLGAITAICAGITALLYEPQTAPPPVGASRDEAASPWDRLPEFERRALSLRYRAIAGRPDADDVFQRVREFADLPAAEQAQLRMLYRVLEDAIKDLPPARQRSLRSLHERARAEAVYRLLESQSPETIADLRNRLDGHS